MPSIKKFLYSLFTFFILFSSTLSVPLSNIHAQTKWYAPSFTDWYVKTYDPAVPESEIFGERYTAAQVTWIVYSIPAFIVNSVVGPDLGACMIKLMDPSNMSDTLDLSALPTCAPAFQEIFDMFAGTGSTNTNVAQASDQTLLEAVFEKRPISFITYVDDVGKNLKIIPEAQAQQTGFGFAGLSPVLKLWQISRNICYGLMVIVIIAMSFMIMFRMKLNPQTVITVQSALPKIVSALILITFSYAIAGLLIDLMYVVFGLVALIMSSLFDNGNPVHAFNLLVKGQPSNLNVNLGVFGLFLFYLIFFAIGFLLALIGTYGVIMNAIGLVVGTGILLAIFGTGIGGIVLLILFLIFLIMLVVMFFKTAWVLLKAYANTLIQTITAPFQILLGTFMPNMGFGNWVKSYMGNLSIFIVVGTLFQLSFLFMHVGLGMIFQSGNFGNGLFNVIFGNNVITNVGPASNANDRAWPPLLGGGNSSGGLLMFGVSFIIFSSIPKAAKIVEAFMKGQMFNFESAVGEAVGPVKAVGMYGLAEGMNTTEAAAKAAGEATPAKVQVLRRLLGLKA